MKLVYDVHRSNSGEEQVHSDSSDTELPRVSVRKPMASGIDSDSEDDVILQQVLRKSLYDAHEHCHGASGSRHVDEAGSRK